MTTYVLTATYQSTRRIVVALSAFLCELVRDGVQYHRQLAVDDLSTLVPGGVGPMKIAMLMANTITASYRSVGRDFELNEL